MRPAFAGGGFVVGVAVCWGWLYARFGHGGDDGGFVLALAWRVLQGDVPYRDFVYIRPPLSPLLHALPMALLPKTAVVMAERVLFYASVGGYSWVAAGLLARRGGVVPQPLLAGAGFVVSVLWFPPMAWHTVDGILLAVLGIACLFCEDGVRRERAAAALGGLLLVAAALTKQPYALVPIVGIAVSALTYGRRRAVPAIAGAVSGLLTFAAVTVVSGVAGPMVALLVGETGVRSLVHAGALTYARGVVHGVVPPLAAWLALRAIGRVLGLRFPWAAFAWLLVFWSFGACLFGVISAARFQPPLVNFPAALLVLGGLATARDWRCREPAAPLAALLLVVAWCASISWGWQTPALFATPILFAVLEAARRHTAARPRPLAWAILALGLVLQFAGYQRPYADAPRAELVHGLGAELPRLSGVMSTPTYGARLAEFRDLYERYGAPSFTVLPGFPLAHFLVDASPPPGVDWARNPETAGRTAELASALESRGTRAFVERDRRVCREGAECSALLAHVVERWTRVERGRYFDVYVPAQASREARDGNVAGGDL